MEAQSGTILSLTLIILIGAAAVPVVVYFLFALSKAVLDFSDHSQEPPGSRGRAFTELSELTAPSAPPADSGDDEDDAIILTGDEPSG